MWRKLKRFDLDALCRVMVALGVFVLSGLVVAVVREQPDLNPSVVAAVLVALLSVVHYYFPRKS